MKKILANSNSYGSKRNRASIRYIVIHYTGVKNDTAVNEAEYFKYRNTRKAGAHFFIGQKGQVVKSVPMNRTAWSVGGLYSLKDGAGRYYLKCTNANSVSIELCDNLDKDPSKAQIKAVQKTIRYIRKYCKNAHIIIRHWDVNGKECPLRMIGTENKKWIKFKKQINVN